MDNNRMEEQKPYDSLAVWNSFKRPPKEALKPIMAGRLRGKTDINPQWRYQVLTKEFGPCGDGWKYEIKRVWTEPGPENQVFAFAEVALYTRTTFETWSYPIPGIGGSMLVAKESSGLHANDEGYKMAITDALSVACKMLGVAADVYLGQWEGERYSDESEFITQEQAAEITKLILETNSNTEKFLKVAQAETIDTILAHKYEMLIKQLQTKKAKAKKSERQPGEDDK